MAISLKPEKEKELIFVSKICGTIAFNSVVKHASNYGYNDKSKHFPSMVAALRS